MVHTLSNSTGLSLPEPEPLTTPSAEYLPTAAVTAAENLAMGITDAVTISGGSDKYLYSCDPAYDNSAAVLVADYEFAVTFYMPIEPEEIPDGETTATGDRLNKGDKVAVYSGMSDAPTNDCSDGTVKLTLGAATLAAGSLAIAAALLY